MTKIRDSGKVLAQPAHDSKVVPIGGHKSKKTDKKIPIADLVEVSRQGELDCSSFFEGKKPVLIQCLPKILQASLSIFKTNIDKDLVLLGSLTAISAVLPNYVSLYAGKLYYPNLNVNIIAAYGSGKGVADPCRFLVKEVDDWLFTEISEKIKNETNEKSLSGAAMKKRLFVNDGRGLVWETEGIGLANAASQDWGKDIPEIFLRACEHEPITYNRSNWRIRIEEPQLSSFMAFVPSGISAFLDKESGYFSRMIYYLFDPPLVDIDPFSQKVSYKEHFQNIGKSVFPIYNHLKGINELDPNTTVSFEFTDEQKVIFTTELNKLRRKYGKKWTGIIQRLHLQYLRIAMILSLLENWEENNCQEISPKIICSDNAVLLAEYMFETLFVHTLKMYSLIPNRDKDLFSAKIKADTKADALFNALPSRFKSSELHQIAESLSISKRTADRYLSLYKRCQLINGAYEHYFKK
jgi:Protein of unknown function (DUF3987)